MGNSEAKSKAADNSKKPIQQSKPNNVMKNTANANNNKPQSSNNNEKTVAQGGALPSIPDNEEQNVTFKMTKKINKDDFEFLTVIGRGSFGKVMQVRKKDDGKIYAMKVLVKKQLVKRKQIAHTQSERKVLSNISHPFIVSLHYAFQTDAKLYMILDFYNGGELFSHLKREGRFGEKRSKYYGGEICLALHCLHSKGIIYRDLKPENVLLDNDGHIKITDFGLSKDSIRGDGLTHTFCGTPEYLAPEVLAQSGHGKAVDWWSFGTLLYEMMTGLPPFYNQNLNVMYEKILHAPIPLPKYLSKEARSIFLGLLERDPIQRLGSGELDGIEIQRHGFFASLDFKKLEAKEIKPPFKPKVQGADDTSQIDAEFTDEKPKDTYVANTGSVIAAAGQFGTWTYDATRDNTVLN